MNLLFSKPDSPKNQIQTRLMILAAGFLFLGCLALTFAPAVRIHSWVAKYKWEQWVGFVVWVVGFTLLHHQLNRYLPDHDPYLLPLVSILTGWGLLIIYRLDPAFGFRQSAWLGVAVAGFIIALRIPQLLHILRRYKYVWLSLGLLLILLTFFFGTYPGGSGPGLWLGCCGVYIQPSELLKLLLVIYLAAYLADRLSSKFKLVQLLTPTLVVAGVAILILIAQRDLGTASLFIVLYTLIIYLASGKRRVLLICLAAILFSLAAGYLVFDVIKLRIEAWINPWLDPLGRSYQIVQSIIAIANGGLLGRGIGLGSPGVVPVAQSDFIYTAIIEEFGLAGSIALVSILALFALRGVSVALHAPNHFQRFLAAGITSLLVTQSILIMGGTIRLLPLTGVTLPFVSYGGTSLLTSFFAILLLLIISNQSEDLPATLERSRPYLVTGTFFLTTLAAIALVTGWWSFIRANTLVNRSDNPRRYISDRYAYRGIIYDRNNRVLAQSVGESGSFTRKIEYPSLSAVIGYSNPTFGQTGIEYYLDPYLRGVSGNSTLTIERTRILFGQYPAGLDVRLSLDLGLQEFSDDSLSGHTGSLIVMNADSGEILVMSTAPTFNANELTQNWEKWNQDTSAPLLNRATQAEYPPGSALVSLILPKYLESHRLPSTTLIQYWSDDFENPSFCAVLPSAAASWGELLRSGCRKPVVQVSESLPATQIIELFNQTGLTAKPKISIETNPPASFTGFEDFESLVKGTTDFLVSPLQLMIAAATLSNGGKIITPQLEVAFKSPENDWILFDTGPSTELPGIETGEAVNILTEGTFPGWEVSSLAVHNDARISWYLAGTPPDWQGTPLVIVVALEDGSPQNAKDIGRQVYLQALTPTP